MNEIIQNVTGQHALGSNLNFQYEMNDNGFIEPTVVATNGGLGKMFLSSGTP